MKACRIEICFGNPRRDDGKVDRILADVSDEIGAMCQDFLEENRIQILKRVTERFNLAWEYMARREAESQEYIMEPFLDPKLADEIAEALGPDGPVNDDGEEESDIDWGPNPLDYHEKT